MSLGSQIYLTLQSRTTCWCAAANPTHWQSCLLLLASSWAKAIYDAAWISQHHLLGTCCLLPAFCTASCYLSALHLFMLSKNIQDLWNYRKNYRYSLEVVKLICSKVKFFWICEANLSQNHIVLKKESQIQKDINYFLLLSKKQTLLIFWNSAEKAAKFEVHSLEAKHYLLHWIDIPV